MKSVLSCVAVVIGLFWVGLCLNSQLPDTVSVDNIATDPNASTAALMTVQVALSTGMLETEIQDYCVFRTAKLSAGDTQIRFVALPGTKWYRYE